MVASGHRKGQGAIYQSSLNFFRFFFYRLGCSFYWKDHVYFHVFIRSSKYDSSHISSFIFFQQFHFDWRKLSSYNLSFLKFQTAFVLPRVAWENSRHFVRPPRAPRGMTSEKRAPKSHTYVASLPRSVKPPVLILLLFFFSVTVLAFENAPNFCVWSSIIALAFNRSTCLGHYFKEMEQSFCP